jgi:hypothetical protein
VISASLLCGPIGIHVGSVVQFDYQIG